MKNQLNKNLIEELNESSNSEFIESINNKVLNLTSNVLNDLSYKSPFVHIDKCVFQAVNEAYLGTFTQLSEFTYFLGIENPQLEFNTKSKKHYLRFLWREFKANFRLGRKKYKKRKSEPVSNAQPASKYSISDVCHDFGEILSNYLSETSLIYEHNNHISIIGQDDFGTGVRINIFFCVYSNEKQTFKIFQERKNKFFACNFGQRFDNLTKKINSCGQMYVDMIKIFNAIYSKAYNKIANQILLESILFDCPDSLFEKENLFNTFINVANYIRISTPNKFASICDQSKSIFDEPLIVKANQQIDFSRIVNMLNSFKY